MKGVKREEMMINSIKGPSFQSKVTVEFNRADPGRRTKKPCIVVDLPKTSESDDIRMLSSFVPALKSDNSREIDYSEFQQKDMMGNITNIISKLNINGVTLEVSQQKDKKTEDFQGDLFLDISLPKDTISLREGQKYTAAKHLYLNVIDGANGGKPQSFYQLSPSSTEEKRFAIKAEMVEDFVTAVKDRISKERESLNNAVTAYLSDLGDSSNILQGVIDKARGSVHYTQVKHGLEKTFELESADNTAADVADQRKIFDYRYSELAPALKKPKYPPQ